MKEARAGKREISPARARRTEGGRYELGDLLPCLFFLWISNERIVAVLGGLSSPLTRQVAPAVPCALPRWTPALWDEGWEPHVGYSVLQHDIHDGVFVLVRRHGLFAHPLLHNLVCVGAAGFGNVRAGWCGHRVLVPLAVVVGV